MIDTFTLLIMLHVIGTILGTGGATVAELQITKALKDKKVSSDEKALMHVNYGMIRVGMGLLLISVIGMFWYFYNQGSNYLFTTEKLWIKDLMFAMIFLNAIALHKRWVPLWLGASTSFTSWWGATLLGLAGTLPYSFTTYLAGYIIAIFAVAGITHVIRNFNQKMNKKVFLLATAILVMMVFVGYTMLTNLQTDESNPEAPSTKETAIYRELKSVAVYDAPGIVHRVEFSIFVDEDGIIQNVNATELDHEGYEEKLGSFSDTVTATIKGKKLVDLEAVDRVGTSSLTTAGFNEALDDIKTKV